MSDPNPRLHYDPPELLRIAYRAAAQVTNSPLVAEEAGERAVHRCTLAWLAGHPPRRPEAWVRVVARRTATQMAQTGWNQVEAFSDPNGPPDPLGRNPANTTPRTPWRADAFADRLPPRQRQALTAALSCNTTRDAARACGMQPRDFRRQLATITRKARSLFAPSPDLHSPSPLS
ncbi:MAG: sigma-70 family RNA polymerase sigma factor [Planctomycetes bacterium]|nr:sigma-70 family RNA polymerase sigma factor [Planctomycetota bacterium]